jgi:hypothetical protein
MEKVEENLSDVIIELCELNDFYICLSLVDTLVFYHNIDEFSTRKSKNYIYHFIINHCIRKVKAELSLITQNDTYSMKCLYMTNKLKKSYKSRKTFLEDLLKILNTDTKINKKIASTFLQQIKRYDLGKE